MSDLSQFPITSRWKPEHPELLQLYSLNTPNGVKVGIMLEEIGLPYEPHLVDIAARQETFVAPADEARSSATMSSSARSATAPIRRCCWSAEDTVRSVGQDVFAI